MKKNIPILISCILIIYTTGCKKLLDEKSDQQLVVPSSLADFQAIMDNFSALNNQDLISAEISADDYYITDVDLAALTNDYHRRMYTWQKDFLFAPRSNDWSAAYKGLYTVNAVLEGLEGSKLASDATYKNIKAQALVFKSKILLQALGLWAKAYTISSDSDLGIPLRPTTDFNVGSSRATVKEGYANVLSNLRAAIPLLPSQQISSTRPSKAAAYGLLARVLLYMGNYMESEKYADSCLKLSPTLLDYNTLKTTDRYPFVQFNSEVIFTTFIPPATIINSTRGKIVPELISSYNVNDLRKGLFFLQTGAFYYFKGTYFQPALFFGVASDEMYLNLAECQIRNGRVDAGIETLNSLLIKRFKVGTFVPLKLSDQSQALTLVLAERRKELVMRGLRWMDIKRLNAEGRNIIISRTVSGSIYSLQPNDKRYALPIPEDIIDLTGMPQNDR